MQAAVQTQATPTLMRMETNHGADHHDIQFAQRRSMSAAMRAGCRAAVRASLVDGASAFDLGLGEPVLVTLDDMTRRKVREAVGMIAYRDDNFDGLFFVYRHVKGFLCAVLGGSKDMARSFDGWLDFDRYIALAWDSMAGSCREVFAVPDFGTLWTDVDGDLAGADIDGTVVTVTRDHLYTSYDRVPQPVLMRIAAMAAAQDADDQAKLRGAFNG